MELIELADFAQRGLLPDAGGVLDQHLLHLAAIRFIWSEQAAYRL